MIEYYYNLKPKEIVKKEGNYFFSYINKNYVLKKINFYTNSLKDIYELNKNNNIGLTSDIIQNKDNNIFTFYNDNSYVLFEIKINYYKKILIEDICDFMYTVVFKEYNSLNMTNWEKLWEIKNDYIENQIELLDRKYPLLCLVSNYYIGLSENAIKLKKYINSIKENAVLTISHRRIKYNDCLFELYNPLNYIIDYRIRDIGEFFKSLYFSKNVISSSIIINFIKKYNLSFKEALLLFDRLLYPSYYFDLFDKTVLEELENQKIIFLYIEQSKNYEKELQKIYIFIEEYYNKKLPNIFWLLKKEV